MVRVVFFFVLVRVMVWMIWVMMCCSCGFVMVMVCRLVVLGIVEVLVGVVELVVVLVLLKDVYLVRVRVVRISSDGVMKLW